MMQSETDSRSGPTQSKAQGTADGRSIKYYEVTLPIHELVPELQERYRAGYSLDYLSWWQQIMIKQNGYYPEGCWYEIPEDEWNMVPHQVEGGDTRRWILDLIDLRQQAADDLHAINDEINQMMKERLKLEEGRVYEYGPRRRKLRW